MTGGQKRIEFQTALMEGKDVAKCDGCGAEVPQEDIDGGLAFSDGKNTYCRACVKRLISELSRIARRAEAEATGSAPVVKVEPRRRVWLLMVVVAVCAFVVALVLAKFLLFKR